MSVVIGGVPHVRMLQTSPDTPPVDVFIDGRLAVQDVGFARMTDYVRQSPGDHHLHLFPAGKVEEKALLFHAELEDLRANEDYTVAILGWVRHLHALLLRDRTQPPWQGRVKVRFLHAAPDTPPIDVAYAGGDLLFRNIAYRHVTDFEDRSAGAGDIEIRQHGDEEPILTLPHQVLAAGSIYTLVAAGLLTTKPDFTVIPFVETIPVRV